MISQEALQKILGIEEKIHMTAEEMADKLNITFFPYHEDKVSEDVRLFGKKLHDVLKKFNANIVPFDQALEIVPVRYMIKRGGRILMHNILALCDRIMRSRDARHFIHARTFGNLLKRRRIKKGISVVALGENKAGALPMDFTSSFTESTVITVLDWPAELSEEAEFHHHFDTAIRLFAYHMTDIVIAVRKDRWLLYNFNAAHPIYTMSDRDIEWAILHSLIPKIVAPIRPLTFSHFTIEKEPTLYTHTDLQPFVQDFIDSGPFFEERGLYPKGRSIDDLPFRNNFYRWIGKIHLDQRSGMSYGFLALQLPNALPRVISFSEAKEKYGRYISDEKDYFFIQRRLFLIVELSPGEKVVLLVPSVTVLSQRSGCNKTAIQPETDLLTLGLRDGEMFLGIPKGIKTLRTFRPSFDTRVILAHAVGNAIIAALLKYCNPSDPFSKQAEEKGVAIAHWHGYFHPKHVPKGWRTHGLSRPHVSCSSPQSALFAIGGKLETFRHAFRMGEQYLGDIHIEPHHGTNITFPSLRALAEFLQKNQAATRLGDSYLKLYTMGDGTIS